MTPYQLGLKAGQEDAIAIASGQIGQTHLNPYRAENDSEWPAWNQFEEGYLAGFEREDSP